MTYFKELANKTQDQTPMVSLKNIYKTYVQGKNPIPVLKGVELSVHRGEMVAIMGSSGSGKSTLLNIIGLLDDYDQGEYLLAGKFMGKMNETQAAAMRNQHLGFIFQSFHLIPFKTAQENVALPLFFQKMARKKRNQKALEYLEMLGMAQWAAHLPNELSGGQKQRVAIARAMITNPDVILADEPTGSLDNDTSLEVMKLFKEINAKGITILVITHEKEIAAMAHRILYLHDGKIDLRKSGS